MTERVDPRALRGYALGSVATGSFGTVPGLLLLPYLTDRLGVAAGVAGLIVFLPKFWDVILNPIAGRISDRFSSPQGRRRPFLLRAGLLLALGFLLMLSGPTAPPALAAAWVVILFLGCATAFGFFQVPYLSMAAEMTTDPRERTRVMAWRVAVLAVAILVSGALSPIVREAFGPEWGYRAVGLFVALLIATGITLAWWGTRHLTLHSFGESTGSLREQLRVVAASRHFRLVLVAFVLQALGTGCVLAGVDYMARYVLASPGFASVLFAAFVGPALVVTPLWHRLAARRGKRAAYAAATVVFGVSTLLSLPAAQSSRALTALVVAVMGIGYAGCQMLPMAMLSDVAAYEATQTGVHRVGTFTGVWTAGETLGFALGPLLYAAVLAAGGYISSTTANVGQPPSAVTAIGVGFAYLPGVLMLCSLLFIRRYTLTEDDVTRSAEGVLR